MKKKLFFLSLVISILFTNCSDEITQNYENGLATTSATLRSVTPPEFNWENADWMPTPSSQNIPSPWSGQGSIASTYSLSVVNDRKASDGWVLLYNTFDKNASSKLVNPYFVLYNKYRGLMRIFTYMTTDFVSYSSYIKEGIKINSNNGYGSSMLRFLGQNVIDPQNKQSFYKQIQPAPMDGSAPFASRKWYLSEYEIAYDPTVTNKPYQDMQIIWSLEYQNITKIELGGKIQGTISSQTGGNTNGKQIVSELEKTGKVAGGGVLSGIGSEFLNKNSTNKETGENKIGLPKDIYKSILKGATSAVSSNVGKLPETVMGLFSAILGGSSSTTNINLAVDLDVKLDGSSTNTGSFPSSPTSVWVPGTNITSSATGYIPLYNKNLGVFNVTDNLPAVKITGTDYMYFNMNWAYMPVHIELNIPRIDFTPYILINPELQKEATVTIRKQELILRLSPKFQYSSRNSTVKRANYEKLDKWAGNSWDVPDRYKDRSINCYVNPTYIYLYYEASGSDKRTDYDFVVRITVDVKPKNGSPMSTIVKTFQLKTDNSNLQIRTISSKY